MIVLSLLNHLVLSHVQSCIRITIDSGLGQSIRVRDHESILHWTSMIQRLETGSLVIWPLPVEDFPR